MLLAGDWLDEKKIRLSKTTQKVLDLINSRWPMNPMETAMVLDDKHNLKTSSSKYVYHFKKLSKAGLIELKKIGNTYVAWPKDLEKMRDIEKKRRLMIVYDI